MDSPGQQNWYDPNEVEAYVARATHTIRALQARLQQAQRRVEQADAGMGDGAGLSQDVRRAREVADRTIADARLQGAAIIRAAEDRAAAIVDAAHLEARRLVDGARGAAADVFQVGEARLVAAVRAFVEGSDVLQAEMARVPPDDPVRVRSRSY